MRIPTETTPGEPEHTMAHTYNANFVHYIFSTKDRRNTIPPELEEKLWAYLLGIANNLRIKTLAIGGTANHLHMLLGLPPTMSVADAVQKLKANSSRWLGEHQIRFQWQEGYGAFSVSRLWWELSRPTSAIRRSTIANAVSKMSFVPCWRRAAFRMNPSGCLWHECRP
jgi:REP element-mobilizing transposase RayT